MKTILKVIKWFFIFLLAAFMTIMILGLIFAACDDASTVTPTDSIGSTLPSSTETVIKPAPIKLIYVSWEQDCVGGNSIRMVIENLTNKNISWVEYTLSLKNIKGELLKDSIRGWTSIAWYDGPIAPGGHIEINGGTFYNYNFKGSIQVNNILIHYEDGTEEEINFRNIEDYQPIIYNSNDSIVYTGEHSPSYHTKDCRLHEYNTYNLEMTIAEARALGKDRCVYCNPY